MNRRSFFKNLTVGVSGIAVLAQFSLSSPSNRIHYTEQWLTDAYRDHVKGLSKKRKWDRIDMEVGSDLYDTFQEHIDSHWRFIDNLEYREHLIFKGGHMFRSTTPGYKIHFLPRAQA